MNAATLARPWWPSLKSSPYQSKIFETSSRPVADRIDVQLDSQAERFMSDRSRYRYNVASGRLEVSKIFDGYGADFKQGHKGIASAQAFYARYAGKLSDAPDEQQKIRALTANLSFLDCDWRLNDVPQ